MSSKTDEQGWAYYVRRVRVCSACDGDGYWPCADRRVACSLCNGVGVEQQVVPLDVALRSSDVIKELQASIEQEYWEE